MKYLMLVLLSLTIACGPAGSGGSNASPVTPTPIIPPTGIVETRAMHTYRLHVPLNQYTTPVQAILRTDTMLYAQTETWTYLESGHDYVVTGHELTSGYIFILLNPEAPTTELTLYRDDVLVDTSNLYYLSREKTYSPLDTL